MNPPILFLVFNRPATTARVFEAIRQARPANLYIAADGPRAGKEGESLLCEETRRIASAVDWPCKVRTLFREQNMGCKNAVRSAIDWFFENEEMGIVLEDDCLPDESFFPFCAEMLSRYEMESRVKIVSGTNYFFGSQDHRNTYFFSPFMPIWGWATWRRAWQEVDYTSLKYDEAVFRRKLAQVLPDRRFRRWLQSQVDQSVRGELNSWDLYPVMSYVQSDGVGITPFRNLVTNLGEMSSRTGGTEVTSGEQPSAIGMATCAVDVSGLEHPAAIAVDRDAVLQSMQGVNRVVYSPMSLLRLLRSGLRRLGFN